MTDLSDRGELVLDFADGIPGFPQSHRFVLSELAPDSAFQILASVDEPDVSMVVSVPWTFFPDYAPELGEDDQRGLGIERPEDAVVFCAVTLDAEADTVYLNLAAPFVVNIHSRRGRQLILEDSAHPLRAPVPLAG